MPQKKNRLLRLYPCCCSKQFVAQAPTFFPATTSIYTKYHAIFAAKKTASLILAIHGLVADDAFNVLLYSQRRYTCRVLSPPARCYRSPLSPSACISGTSRGASWAVSATCIGEPCSIPAASDGRRPCIGWVIGLRMENWYRC